MNIQDTFFPLKNGRIKYNGITDKINKFVEETQLFDEDLWTEFVAQFSKKMDAKDGGWRGEYWGKMMRGACLTYSYTRNQKLYLLLKKEVLALLSKQDSQGRICTYTTETEFSGWDMWGRKYVMLGMLYFMDICKDRALRARIVKALKKHADYIVERVGDGKISVVDTSGMLEGLNASSILEPFVKLYNITKEERYLSFAEHIISVGFTKSQNLIDLVLENKLYPYEYNVKKAYEMMSCFQGLLEYYKIRKNPRHLQAVVAFFDAVAKSELTEIGAMGCNYEYFNNSEKTQTEECIRPMLETCVTVTWMNCCYQLLAFTGDVKYANWIEKSAKNAMFGAVNIQRNKKLNKWYFDKNIMLEWDTKGMFFPFDSYSPILNGRRAIDIGGKRDLTEDGKIYGCCYCIGSAGTAIAALYGVMQTQKGYVFNDYDRAFYRLKTPNGNEFSVKVTGDAFVGNGKIKFTFKMKETEKMQIKFRIPDWSDKTKIRCNGQEIFGVKPNSYFDLEREFSDGDKIEISLDNSVKAIQKYGKILLKKGAYVLARDERYDDGFDGKQKPILTKKGKPNAKRVHTGTFDCLGEYAVQTEDGQKITLCDYASAGKDWDYTDKLRITAWM